MLSKKGLSYMKKTISLLALLASILVISSCSSTPNDDTSDNMSMTVESFLKPESDNEYQQEIVYKDIANAFMHDAIECQFLSVQDLEIYLYTGSTNNSDYSNSPVFENFPTIGEYATNEYAKRGYVPFSQLFGIDPDQCENFELVSFQLTPDCVIFNYYFQKNCITVTYSPNCFSGRDISDYYQAYCTYISKEYVEQSYLSINQVESGFLSREINNCKFLYTVKNSLIRKVSFILDYYMIEVTTASSNDIEVAKQEYKEFLNDKEMSSVAALFSENSEKVYATIQRMAISKDSQ